VTQILYVKVYGTHLFAHFGAHAIIFFKVFDLGGRKSRKLPNQNEVGLGFKFRVRVRVRVRVKVRWPFWQ
jgi:hypothetical protein